MNRFHYEKPFTEMVELEPAEQVETSQLEAQVNAQQGAANDGLLTRCISHKLYIRGLFYGDWTYIGKC